MGIEVIEQISHKYGSNSDFVLAGGGNTSYKDDKYLYIKGSGTALATITKEGFVKMSRESLAKIWEKTYSQSKDEREAQVLEDMMKSKCEGEEAKRPSVETLLHNLFKQPYILHVHPAIVNGLTCSQKGEKVMKKLFPCAIWIPETEPGYVLASKCRNLINEYEAQTGNLANLLFLQNHGVFFAANDEKEMDELVASVMSKLIKKSKKKPNFDFKQSNESKVSIVCEAIKKVVDGAFVNFTFNKEIAKLSKSRENFEILMRPMTPDHIVYCKAQPLFVDAINCEHCAKRAIDAFEEKNGYKPKVIFVKEVGMFTVGTNEKDAKTVTDVWLDAIKISVFAQNFGGVRHMAPEMVDFIANWEVENYRSKVALENK